MLNTTTKNRIILDIAVYWKCTPASTRSTVIRMCTGRPFITGLSHQPKVVRRIYHTPLLSHTVGSTQCRDMFLDLPHGHAKAPPMSAPSGEELEPELERWIHTHTLTMARLTWVQTAGGTVRTARSTRGDTGTRAGPNGAIGRITYRLDPRVGPLHRGTAWLGVGLRAD